MDYRNSQPFGRGTQDHDCLCPYRYLHWINLPYCTALRGWRYQQNYWLCGNSAPCNLEECHFEQCRRYLSFDVGLTALPSLYYCTDTLSSFPLVCALFAAIAIMTTSSRMIYAFARYVFMGIWCSKLAVILILLIVMAVSLRLPSSLAFTPSWMSPWTRYISIWLSSLSSGVSSWAHPGKHMHNVLSWILLTSPSAFNAIVSASVVLLGISYGMPIAVNCCRGRTMLPERSFVLSEIVGWIVNLVWDPPLRLHWNYYWLKTSQVSLAYIALTTILFLFPPELPATGSNMSKLALSFCHAKAQS